MNEHKVVDRAELFEKFPERDDGGSDLLPNLNLEFVEIDCRNEGNSAHQINDDKPLDDEFEFPLFSFGVSEALSQINTELEIDSDEQATRGRTALKLMKVSLREPSPVLVKNERPRSYYFTNYTQEEKRKYSESAVDVESLLNHANLKPFEGWNNLRGTVLDVEQHNLDLEVELSRALKSLRRRPGKKQRMGRKVAEKREAERQQRDLEIKKLIKKKFHKRGGKKNKKTSNNPLENARMESKPKFGTK